MYVYCYILHKSVGYKKKQDGKFSLALILYIISYILYILYNSNNLIII